MSVKISDLDEARLKCGQSFRLYVEWRASTINKRPPLIHYIMADFFQGTRPEWIGRTKRIMGFRYAAKSTIWRWYCEWRWLRNPKTQIIIHSSSDRNAKKMARAVKNGLRTNILLSHLSPRGKTGDFEFNLHRIEPESGYSLTCAGINTSVTSQRCDLYGFDDPEPDVDPQSMRERVLRAFEEAAAIIHPAARHLDEWKKQGSASIPTPETTQIVVIGQPHYEDTAYFANDDERDPDTEDSHPLEGCPTLIIPATLSDHLTWTWPEIMVEKYTNPLTGEPPTVHDVRRTMSTAKWELEYMINPGYAKKAGKVLDLHNVRELHRIPRNAIMAIDPADGHHCEWGVTIGSLYEADIHISWMGGFEGEAYDWVAEDESQGEAVWSKIFDLAMQFNVASIILEINLKSAQTSCRRYMKRHGHRFNVIEYRARLNKLKRIRDTLEPLVNNGVFTAEPHVLEDSLTRRQFTRLLHDKLPVPCDRIDSLAMLADHFIREHGLSIEGHAADPIKFPQAKPRIKPYRITNKDLFPTRNAFSPDFA